MAHASPSRPRWPAGAPTAATAPSPGPAGCGTWSSARTHRRPWTASNDCESLSKLPELVEEEWLRGIGDAHFTAAGELAEAIAAYKKVAGDKESKY